MKIKDIFKVAASAAIGWGASKLIPGPVGAAVGKTLSSSLMSRGGSGTGDASGAFVPRSINLSQFGMGTYQAGTARSTPIQQISTDPLRLRAEWDYRLREYMLLRRYMKSTTT